MGEGILMSPMAQFVELLQSLPDPSCIFPPSVFANMPDKKCELQNGTKHLLTALANAHMQVRCRCHYSHFCGDNKAQKSESFDAMDLHSDACPSMITTK